MTPYQEPKYKIDGNKIVNRQSGQAIPEDEPLFILRARDIHAAQTLMFYGAQITDPKHREAVHTRCAQFNNWAAVHRDRMKEPDTQMTFEWTSAGTGPGAPAKMDTEAKVDEALKRGGS